MDDASAAVSVRLGARSYGISIGQGTLATAPRVLLKLRPTTHVVVITDSNVEPLYAQGLVGSIREAGPRVDLLVVPAGESSKSVAEAARLWHELLRCGADRSSVIVAAGGGVVGDLAGFVAATFARGIALLQIPTSLLAQVDSSVGGKVGINLPQAKNIVGAFWQPLGVVIDTDVLKSLADREYRSGLGEVVKYGVILDAALFTYLETQAKGLLERDPDVLEHVIARCCELKAGVVAEDEQEQTGLRAILNYGHTFGHALEAATGYAELLHGEAVAIGMLRASRLAELLGRVDADMTRRQYDLLRRLELPTDLPDVPVDELVRLMSHDKKIDRGQLRFVLPDRMGHVELVGDVDTQVVLAALESNP
jgi:3-dehydroquinate synthase